MSVIVERNGPVTTLVIARPERRNAVDRPTAQALADALREFEADDTARVAVLTGSGGNFCAGADLAAVAEDGERRNRLEAEGDGPMGPSRMRAEAEELAAELAAFPQTCMLADRASVYAQWELSFDVALANEFQGGLAVIESGETLEGAQRFRDGEGRHGRFE